MQSKVPQIRFKGFSGEWKKVEFKDNIISIQTGTNLLGSTANKGIPLIKMGNIQRGFFSLEKIEFLDENIEVEVENIANYGDFLFNTRNTLELVGKGATWMGESGKFAFNSNLARFIFNGLNTIFFNYLYNTQSMIKQVQARAMGTTSVAAIYPKNLNSIKYYLPDLKEQTKIGNFFQKLDQLIDLKEKKYQKLKQFKKASLDKMFPKNGASTPEIRFKGFSGEWEEKELGEVVEIIMGQSPSSKSYNLDKRGIPLIQGNADIQNRLSCPKNWTTEKTKECKIGDLILTVRAPVGAIAKSIHNACIGRGVCAIKNNIESTNEFIYQFLLDYEEKWSILEQGSTFTAVSGTEIRKIKIKIPLIEEQEKIGNYFQKLDKQIDLQLQEIEKLKNIKKALLDKMFV